VTFAFIVHVCRLMIMSKHFMSTGKSSYYKCEICIRLLKSTKTDDTLVKPQTIIVNFASNQETDIS
jgi:hypothetical protein